MRFRIRFSLRTLLVLVLICGVISWWVAAQLDWIRKRREFIRKHPRHYTNEYLAGEKLSAPWPLWLFGEPAHAFISFLSESEAEEARRLFPESKIDTDPWPSHWAPRDKVGG
jgi:hypothetical protein